MMDAEILDNYRKAGRILAEVLQEAKPKVDVGVPLLEVAPQIRICGLPGRQWLARLPWRLEGHRIFQ